MHLLGNSVVPFDAIQVPWCMEQRGCVAGPYDSVVETIFIIPACAKLINPRSGMQMRFQNQRAGLGTIISRTLRIAA